MGGDARERARGTPASRQRGKDRGPRPGEGLLRAGRSGPGSGRGGFRDPTRRSPLRTPGAGAVAGFLANRRRSDSGIRTPARASDHGLQNTGSFARAGDLHNRQPRGGPGAARNYGAIAKRRNDRRRFHKPSNRRGLEHSRRNSASTRSGGEPFVLQSSGARGLFGCACGASRDSMDVEVGRRSVADP